ncbi:MAG: hypothetical protein ACFFCD_17080 [Promethearchaeota archaeon]
MIKKWSNKIKSFIVAYFSSDANNGPGKAWQYAIHWL